MKTRLLTSLACLLAAGMGLQAQEVGVDEALEIARDFTQRAVAGRMMRAPQAGVELSLAHTAQGTDGRNCYYVFNRGAADGYVVVAADERARDVLGYADSGTFDFDNMPTNMKWWLSEYEREIEALPEGAAGSGAGEVRAAPAAEVAPLLGNLAWDQSEPYNNLCPMYVYDTAKRCVTGCVATAMAQVMYYHKWPAVCMGAHSYVCQVNGRSETLSADFSSTAYDWDAMQTAYDGDETDEQELAVATLMYHCGVALEMNYGLESGAQSVAIPRSLYDYFGYDSGMRYRLRDYYTSAEWEQMIRNELDNGRPLEYTGYSTTAGHSFVCDGYDSEGYFHFNWGWGGLSNGYFRLSALEPGSLGTGGGTGAYNFDQSINIGIQPDAGSPLVQDIESLVADTSMVFNKTSIVPGEYVTIELRRMYNKGWSPLDVIPGFVIYNEADELVRALPLFGEPIRLEPNYGYKSYPIEINSDYIDLPDGNYKMYLCGQLAGSDEWVKLRINKNYAQYANVTVDGGIITFSLEEESTPDLWATSIEAATKVYSGKAGQFTATLSNDGGEYLGGIYFALIDGDYKVYHANIYNVNIPAGGEVNMTFTEKIAAAPGNYYMVVLDLDGHVKSDLVPVEVLQDTGVESMLTTTAPLSLAGGSEDVPWDDIRLTVNLRNDGGYYANNVTGYIFDAESPTSVGMLNPEFVCIDMGESVVVEIYGEFPTGTVGEEYTLQVFGVRDGSYYFITPYENSTIRFTLGEAHRGTTVGLDEETVRATVYPNPATDVVTVDSAEALQSVKVYSLGGSLVIDVPCAGELSRDIDVSELRAGAYLLQMTTDSGSNVVKLMKR